MRFVFLVLFLSGCVNERDKYLDCVMQGDEWMPHAERQIKDGKVAEDRGACFHTYYQKKCERDGGKVESDRFGHQFCLKFCEAQYTIRIDPKGNVMEPVKYDCSYEFEVKNGR